MKKLILTLALGIFASALFAQECYFFPQPGKVLEYTATAVTPMGNQNLISRQYVKSHDANSVVVTTEVFQEGGTAPMQTVNLKYDDAGDVYKVDFKEMLSSNFAQLGQFEVLESAGELVYPKNLKVGDRIPSIQMKIKATVQGMSMEMEISQEDRTAEAKETVEVPAGKFECIRFSEKMIVTVLGQDQETVNTYWVAPGVGMVKQSTDAMNGMAKTTLELKSITDKK